MEQKLMYRLKKKKKLPREYVLNTNDCAKKLIHIMQRHIGEEHKISKYNLFAAVYGIEPVELPELYMWYMWDIIKRALHLLRKQSRCQVISKNIKQSRYSTKGGVYFFWVATTYFDFKVYRDNLENTVRNIRKAENRMEKSIKEKWYQHPELWKI